MIVLGRRSAVGLERLLAAARQEKPSYREVGATAGEPLPPAYRHDCYERRVGESSDFGRAAVGLRRWAAHLGAGAAVLPDDPVCLGSTVLVVLDLGPFQMVAPCRIVDIVETDDVFAFAYGTLPGHPEQGEESFRVEQRPDGTFFRIVAFSRPAEPLAKLSGPVGRRIQRTVTARYMAALASYVKSR